MTDSAEYDGIAAEYVLGTLDVAEKAEADALRRTDSTFDRLIIEWQTRFSPLLELSGLVEPPSWILHAVKTSIGATRDHRPSGGDVIQLENRVARWRRVAAVSMALAAALAVWVATLEARKMSGQRQTFMAVLQEKAGSPAFLVSLDLGDRTMTVIPTAAQVQADKSYELWMIDGQASPKSLGLVNAEGAAHPVLPPETAELISRATYAVTLEPRGGSPTGKPTSAPIFVGHLVDSRR